MSTVQKTPAPTKGTLSTVANAAWDATKATGSFVFHHPFKSAVYATAAGATALGYNGELLSTLGWLGGEAISLAGDLAYDAAAAVSDVAVDAVSGVYNSAADWTGVQLDAAEATLSEAVDAVTPNIATHPELAAQMHWSEPPGEFFTPNQATTEMFGLAENSVRTEAFTTPIEPFSTADNATSAEDITNYLNSLSETAPAPAM